MNLFLVENLISTWDESMRRITGIIIIIYSVLLALGCLAELKEDMATSLIGLFGFSLPLYFMIFLKLSISSKIGTHIELVKRKLI